VYTDFFVGNNDKFVALDVKWRVIIIIIIIITIITFLQQFSFHPLATVLPEKTKENKIYLNETIQKHSTNNTKYGTHKHT